MHRSLTSVLAGALTLPVVVLSASVADADHRPAATPRTVGVTLKTDAMPTRVEATSASGRVTCVRVAAGSGRERRIWLSLDGQRDGKVYTRVAARRTSRCLLAGVAAPKGSRLAIRVEENIPGPFDPRATAALTL